MEKLFNRTKRRRLIKQYKSERDKRVCDRIKAILMFDNNDSYTEIADALLVDDETVRRHVENYLEAEKLSPRNGGNDSKLDETATEELVAHLNDVNEICTYVETTFGISYTVSGMTKWLQSQGFRYKNHMEYRRKQPPKKKWLFVNITKNLKSRSPMKILYFVDGSHPQHQTHLAYGWIAKGVRKAVKMTACQKRINLLGAIELQNHQVEYRHVDWVNFESISDFFSQLMEATHPSRQPLPLTRPTISTSLPLTED